MTTERTWQFHYFTEGFVGRAVSKMIDEWNSAGTPVEARLAEALHKLEQSYEDRLRLQWRVHCQRRTCRETWEIVEMRQKWMGSSKGIRDRFYALQERTRKLQDRLDLHLSGHKRTAR